MRFLYFLSCGRKPSRQPDRASPGGAPVSAAVPANQPPRIRAAAAAGAPAHEKRRRRAAAAPGSGASSQWRPSLGEISENGVLRAVATADGKVGVQRSAPPTGKAKEAAATVAPVVRAYGRDCHGDYRHFTGASFIPAFAPTPFLF